MHNAPFYQLVSALWSPVGMSFLHLATVVSSRRPRIKRFERQNARRAQAVQFTQIGEQPESLSAGVDDVVSPEFPERRRIAGVAVTLDGGPVLPEQGCLAGVTQSDFAQPLAGRNDEDAQETVIFRGSPAPVP